MRPYVVHTAATWIDAEGKPVRAIKRINNNAAICVDSAGHQLIALGKGVGFGELPREVSLDDVHRTFYGIDPKYLAFIDEVDPEVLEFAAQFADVVTQQVSYELSANLPITLADHLQFVLKRSREHIAVPMPLTHDVELSHPIEYKLGELAVRGLKRTFNVRVPRNEAAGVALSIVNSKVSPSSREVRETKRAERMIAEATDIVEQDFSVSIDRDSFAYARFATHLRYLFKRLAGNGELDTGNEGLYELLEEQYPEVIACALRIAQRFADEYGIELSREEVVYLTMHVNRIVSTDPAGDADAGQSEET